MERANPDIDLLLPGTDEVIEDTTLPRARLYFNRPDHIYPLCQEHRHGPTARDIS
mgnify:CR=1 FL=1